MENNLNATKEFIASEEYARSLDQQDPLKAYRNRFHFPKQKNGEPYIYFCGNSLGLQPKTARGFVEQEMKDWETRGVEGHFEGETPWMEYHRYLDKVLEGIVGAKPGEVSVMNTLTVNLHLMLVSFYRPTQKRFKILIESDAFPSDRYAVESQIKFHGLDPEKALLELHPRPGEALIRLEDIDLLLEKEGAEIALVLLGGINYYTGQVFDIKSITESAHQQGCLVGFDLAHAAGNIDLDLHDHNVDFAIWCTYKYLNGGPGSLGACFVHKKHTKNKDLPRFSGWWGHNKQTRFNMRTGFDPSPGAEGWQLSNPPILSMAPMHASLQIFEEVGMKKLISKAKLLTAYLEFLLDDIQNDNIRILTPRDQTQRGCQLSVQIKNSGKSLFEKISQAGIIVDWREPDVIRIAPVPLYNSFSEVFRFVEIFKKNTNKA